MCEANLPDEVNLTALENDLFHSELAVASLAHAIRNSSYLSDPAERIRRITEHFEASTELCDLEIIAGKRELRAPDDYCL